MDSEQRGEDEYGVLGMYGDVKRLTFFSAFSAFSLGAFEVAALGILDDPKKESASGCRIG